MNAGIGRIVLQMHGSEASFSELSSTYPLKLLSPRIEQRNVSVVYVMTYGGGLVGGDRIDLSVDVKAGATLVMLSQGSTKVFKTRPGQRPSARSQGTPSDAITTQVMNVTIEDGGALFQLPDPVTCFRSAKYNQLQIFRIKGNASAVILDSVTSGRRALGEEWVFARYHSMNEIWVDEERIAKDVMLLEEQDSASSMLAPRTLADTLRPYSCYATVIMYGPLVQDTIQRLSAEYAKIIVFRHALPPDLLWSFSPLKNGRGCILRLAAKETEDIRTWLGEQLTAFQGIVGCDVYRKAVG
ncbi:UreD-domain-containing protein [Laetiporus sulphureus 93-53]|uniref:UreD-domain-containing protein n=1 Tax=Laetiporus sulphureus 93-53 TaxID=1314785 RepID=A0A165DYK7_9APHY|nr:UreD-domain-containing protein [Laetiporus sulphureus 93-53]KZT05888.1 UreD-domain-containing protein [Laetiporus sulphureus 93-53]